MDRHPTDGAGDADVVGDFADPQVAEAAARVFGDRLVLAHRFARLLADTGVAQGVLGPREVPRLWQRHLLNCAALTALLPTASRVVDVGSGAGLPGLVLAVARPDLRLDLVEPMQRRVSFLESAITELGLGDAVRVHRGRADEAHTRAVVGDAGWVVARAVAPLDRLVTWCVPLLAPDGDLLALKGDRAADEIRTWTARRKPSKGWSAEILRIPTGVGHDVVQVVQVRRSWRSPGPGRCGA